MHIFRSHLFKHVKTIKKSVVSTEETSNGVCLIKLHNLQNTWKNVNVLYFSPPRVEFLFPYIPCTII